MFKSFFSLCLMMLSLQAETLNIVDALGRKVDIEAPIRKGVYMTYYEAIPALDAWDKVVGINRFAYKNPLMHASNNSIENIVSPGTGSEINIETLLRLKPDVVFTWSYKPELVSFLENKGLKVIAFDPKNLQEVYDDLMLQGKILGKQEEAKSVIAKTKALLDVVSSRLKEVSKPKTIIWLWSKPTKLAGGDGVMSDVLRLLGVYNPADNFEGTNPEVSLEKIVHLNPDVIIIWGSAKYNEEDLINNPQWKSIKAIKNKQVFKAPDWGSWSPRVALLALWVASKVYPEHFDEKETEQMIEVFHRDVFGVNL